MTDPQPTTVQIGDGWPPALGDDTYTLTVKQAVVAGGGGEHDFTATYSLTVAGPRFSIAPSDLHSRFPPPNATGSYSALLPQVVLTRATLPWERPLAGSLQVGTLPTPSLALLVVSGAGAPAAQPGTLNDLLDPPVGTQGPTVTLQPYEQGTDPCSYVDLPLADWQAAAPAEADLELLAHLRQADASTKALGDAPPDGWFAVVIANRFPAASEPSTAYLVSLDGLSAFLRPNAPPSGTQAVRMAVLTSWSFIDNGQVAQEFTESLTALDSAALAVPPTAGTPAPASAVLAQGYVPMRHVTRQAETITSFCRGPLTPSPLADAKPPPTYSCPDAALRFDPQLGILDVSYAAAWQLGRLLALNDREIAQAIYQWRRSHTERATRLVGRMMTARRFPSLRLERDLGELMRGHALRRSLARLLADELAPALPEASLPIVDAPPATPRRDTLQPAPEHAALLRALRADPRCWLGLFADDDEPVPEVVATWLGRLQQLYGLPFNLLVPDPRALPPESIRFFHLDPAWIAALTDGALSVGRTTTLDAEHDAAVAGLVDAVAATARNGVRADALGLEAAPPAGGPLSGFLLRSTAIASWRGVEVATFADAAETPPPLPLVRLDRVSDNVLLCLVDGAVGAVRFTQPTEGLQFGVESTTTWKVGLRGLDVGNQPAGKPLGTDGALLTPTSGLLDVSGSAQALANDLVSLQAWKSGTPLSSGDFAVQLLESSQIVDMIVTPAPSRESAEPPDVAALLAEGRAALHAYLERELTDGHR